MRSWPAVALLLLGLGLPAGVQAHAQRGGGGHGGFSSAHGGFAGSHAGGPGFGSHASFGHAGSFRSSARPAFNGQAYRYNGQAYRYNGQANRYNGQANRYNGQANRYGSPQRFAPNGFRNSVYGRGPSATRPQFFTRNGDGNGLPGYGPRNGLGGGLRNGFGSRYPRFGYGRFGLLGFDPFLFDDSLLYPFWDDNFDGFDDAWNDPAFSGPGAPDPNAIDYSAAAPQGDPGIPYRAGDPAFALQYAPQRPQPQPEPAEEDALTLVFKDGRPSEQIHNYALTRTTLYVTGRHTREIPLDQLDLPATEAVNRAAGVAFQLP